MVAPDLLCGITTAVGGLLGDVGNTVDGVVSSIGLRSVSLPPPVSDGHLVQRRELHNSHLRVKYARDEAAHAVAVRAHEALVKRVGSGTSTDLQNNGRDLWYGVTYTLGTPPQSFLGDIDTGSDLTWIAEAACVSPTCTLPGARFNASASSTYVGPGKHFNLNYGSGNVGVSGAYANETVSVAGLSADHYPIGLVTNSSGPQGGIPSIFGLSFPYIGSSGIATTVPFFELYDAQHPLTDKLFAVHLGRKTDGVEASTSTDPQGGIISFGGYNAGLVSSAVEWVPANSSNLYWQTWLKGFKVNGVDLPVLDHPNDAVIDTGAGGWYAPKPIVDAYYAAIPGAVRYQSQYFIPCTSRPNVTLRFGDVEYDVYPPDQISVGKARCFGFLQDAATVSDAYSYLIGDVFLKNVLAVFKWAPERQIGFAKLADCANQPVDAAVLASLDQRSTLPVPQSTTAAPTTTATGAPSTTTGAPSATTAPTAVPTARRRRLNLPRLGSVVTYAKE
ncbi:Pregnancy-associated glycoprotein 1 [Vanrija pseudolonga]|uniref:Pregnancy-associated glycoprotein 1 n=1 Tax=Vanrija pseudolonga TaxID=143232 RepID=A0AAF1BLS5_9TREE|nr:Pregnancy-associated glycoprotein 1 [Vanrija pseudolonga]